jgi:Holliday junction resolvase RusA-like endonuclease
MIQFFMAMKSPPTVTAQEHKVRVVRTREGRHVPQFYDPSELKAVRQRFTALLGAKAPPEPLTGAVRLTTKWLYPDRSGRHRDGEYKITKPDTENALKLFKDCMTAVGFWLDDAQVASEITEKIWVTTSPSGIYVKVEELP